MTERTREAIRKDIESLLEMGMWTADERVEYEMLIEEHPMEGPADALAISEWDDLADACGGELNFD